VAANEGSTQLVLRGYGDPTTVKTTGAYTKDVIAQFGLPEPVAVRTVSERPRTARRRESAGGGARRVPEAVPQAAPLVAPPPPPPKPESASVIIYRGAKGDQHMFPKDSATVKQPQ